MKPDLHKSRITLRCDDINTVTSLANLLNSFNFKCYNQNPMISTGRAILLGVDSNQYIILDSIHTFRKPLDIDMNIIKVLYLMPTKDSLCAYLFNLRDGHPSDVLAD